MTPGACVGVREDTPSWEALGPLLPAFLTRASVQKREQVNELRGNAASSPYRCE